MLDFIEPQISDKPWIDELFSLSGHMGCTYCFGTLFNWQGKYNVQVARISDALIIKSGGDNGTYSFPAGNFDVRGLFEILLNDARENNRIFKMYSITKEQKKLLSELFPGKFEFTEHRDFFDYIYNTNDLINLAGRKYHGKRNHISKFIRTYKNWEYEPMTSENLDECREMAKLWYSLEDTSNGLDDERLALMRAIGNFEALGFSGGVLRVDGKAVAVTLGERLNSETYCTHFEKALTEYAGAYTMINREFAANALSEYKYINREEDMGLEGLRRAKLSYNPAFLLEKYTVRGV